MSLHSDGIDHRIRPTAAGWLVERIGELAVVVGIVEALDVITACWIQSLEDVVDFNHPKRLWPAMCADIRPIGPRPG